MGALIALLLTYLPTIISVAGDVSAIVGGAKSAASAYQFVKQEYPQVADIIEKIGGALPGAGGPAHLDNITKMLFAWSPEQLAAMQAYLPQNTGGGSVGYNQGLTPQ